MHVNKNKIKITKLTTKPKPYLETRMKQKQQTDKVLVEEKNQNPEEKENQE